MYRLKRHISVLLAALLIFPLIYQSAHLVHGHGLQFKSNDTAGPLISHVNFRVELEDCLICDFDYLSFLPGKSLEANPLQVYLQFEIPIRNTEYLFRYAGFNHSLRAPPVNI